MKVYSYIKGDTFNVSHPTTHLDEHVSTIWLDIQGKELTIQYNEDMDIYKIKPESSICIQCFDKKGVINEAYILRVNETNRKSSHITYEIKHANCYFEFDD